MSRREWRCKNSGYPVPHGTVLGRITGDDGLVLSGEVKDFKLYLDTRRGVVACPTCGCEREFHGRAILSAPTGGVARGGGRRA